MRIALYARKSTEQEDRQIQSLDDQLRELGKLAERENLQIVETFVESKSAKTPGGRPEFERLMQGIEEERFEGVLCWSINRLSRNPVDGGRIAYLLQTGKLSVIRTVERTYCPEDNALLLSIENGMATAYLQDLSRNVKRGLRGRLERGWLTCKAPLGYKNNFETKQIDIDPERFGLLQHGWSMLLSGNHTIAGVHRELVRQGLNVPKRGAEPTPISRNGLHNIFQNKFYAGKITVKGTEYPGRHQPMISEYEFERVQAIVSKKTNLKLPNRFEFPFQGVFTCAQCGCACVAEKKTKTYKGTTRTVDYIYYHCSGAKGCPKSGIKQEDVHQLFEDIAEKVKIGPQVAEWITDTTRQLIEQDNSENDVSAQNVDEDLGLLRARLDRLTELRINGELSADEYVPMKQAVLDQIQVRDSAKSAAMERDQRVLRHIQKVLQLAVRAGELSGGYADPMALGHFARESGDHVLNLNKPELNIDEILQKIAGFEPLRNGSESPKIGDYQPSNSVWLGLVTDLLNLARVADMQRCAQNTQSHLERLLRRRRRSLHKRREALRKAWRGSLERSEFWL